MIDLELAVFQLGKREAVTMWVVGKTHVFNFFFVNLFTSIFKKNFWFPFSTSYHGNVLSALGFRYMNSSWTNAISSTIVVALMKLFWATRQCHHCISFNRPYLYNVHEQAAKYVKDVGHIDLGSVVRIIGLCIVNHVFTILYISYWSLSCLLT